MIPYGRQDITDDDIEAVVRTLRSDFLTQGPCVPAFEAAVCDAVGSAHGVAVNSATSALHIACLALGLGKDDILWTTPITFVASANVGHLCGADVGFVDIDPETFNMCPDALARKLEHAEQAGQLPKIIMPVHMCGQSCDMQAIGALAKRHGIAVIEDASHAIGGRYHNQSVGSCEHSDVTVFSFHPVKIITTAEGGLAATNDDALASKMRRLASHGVTRDAALMDGESHGPWYYQQIELGLNYRMTELQAALGQSQIKRLDAYVARRNVLAERYDEILADLPVKRPGRLLHTVSAFHLYVVRVKETQRRRIFDEMRAAGIGVNVHYIPLHMQPYWKGRAISDDPLPKAEAYYAGAISIPLYATMTNAQQDHVVEALSDALLRG